MAIEKYIIDKSDLNALLKGEDLAIQPKGNIRGFCLEIAGNVTNGDMIKAMLNPYKVCEYEYSVHVYLTEEDFWKADYIINCSTNWWNAPYKVDKKYRTKVITRGNCMICGKELTEGLFFCKECENKSEQTDIEFNHKAFYEFLLNTINPNEMEKYRSMFLSSGEIVK